VTLYVYFPKSNISLELLLEVRKGRIFVSKADYHPGCEAFTGAPEAKHLRKWLQRIQGGVKIPAIGYIELDVPDPSKGDPLDPGERNYSSRAACSMGLRNPVYFSFEVRPTDPEAKVYLNGQYLGIAGASFRISDNPANILIRKNGYPDIAKRIHFQEGPNYLDVSFPSKEPSGSKPKPAKGVK